MLSSANRKGLLFNPLGVIIKNVNSSVFCAVKRSKKYIENSF